jgi:predicted permease
MNAFFPILRALLPLFGLIGLGFCLRRSGVLAREHAPALNGLVLKVLLPATIVTGLLKTPTLSPRLLLYPLLFFAMEALLLATCLALARRARFSSRVVGATMLTGVFGNTVFLGYPVAQAIVPTRFPEAVIIDQFGMMIVLYPVAAALGGWLGASDGDRGGAGAALARFFRGPLFLAIVAGVVLHEAPVPAAALANPWVQALVGMAKQCLGYLAQATTPVVLLALGVALQPRGGQGTALPLAMACVFKLILAPLTILLACRAIGLTGSERAIAVLQASMPSGILTSILSREHGLDGQLAIRVVCVTTALSSVTIPLAMALLG